MADKKQPADPGIQQIVAELRKLNAASRKDLIRDKEDRDRAERMAAVDEVQVEQQSGIMTAGQDFQRRFLAGQAKTLIEKGKLGEQDEDLKPATRKQATELAKLFTDRWKALDSAKGEEDREKGKDKKKDDEKKDKSGDFKKSSFLGKAAKGAAGMGLMGLGIGAFMSGLMVWSGVKAFRGEGFPEQAKNISEGWEHFGKMSNKSIAMLGVMLAGGAFLGMAGGVGKSSTAAVGMTAMGAGIGGFMSGIVAAGSITGFDGTTFKENAADVADALEELGSLSTGALATLGLIAVAGAGLGYKNLTGAIGAAAGASLAGAAIGGFMTGIVAVADVTGTVGTGFKDQAANTVAALKSLETLDKKTLTILGVIAGGGALIASKGIWKQWTGPILATKAAAGASLAGAAIGGFMVGMAAPAKITKVDGTVFKDQAANIVEALKSLETLDEKTLLILGTVAAGGAALGLRKGVGTALSAAGGAAIGGAAIGGFMVGMAAPSGLTKITGTTFKDNALNTVEALKALETLDVKTLTVLGLIAGAGAALVGGGKGKTGIATAGRAALGASIMGGGIGGFMVGMTAAAKLGSMAGVDGSAFKEQATNIAEGMGAFTGPQQAAIVGFLTLGAGLGAIPGIGALGALGIAGSMTLIGAGIGGFFTGMAGIGDLAAAMGVDGSGLNDILSGLGGGLTTFNTVDGSNLISVGGGVISLAAGLTALGAALFGTGVADTVGDAVQGWKNAWNWKWLSGEDDKDTGASGLQNMMDNIVGPMETLAQINDLTLGKSAEGIKKVVGVMNQLSGLTLKSSDFEFREFTDDFVYMAHGIDAAFNGGNFGKPGLGNDITIKTGIKDLSLAHYQTASNGIMALQSALGYKGNENNAKGSVGNTSYITNNYNNYSSEKVTFEGKQGFAPLK